MLVVFLAIGVYVVYRMTAGASGVSAPGTRMSPSTARSISDDLAELPRDVRDYVMSFVVDPASLAEDFDDGADALERGCAVGGKVGVDYAISSMAETYNATASASQSEPTMTMTPSSAPIAASASPASTTPAPAGSKPDSTWCYPRAAARLRAIAAEKRAGLGDAIVSAGLVARSMMSGAAVSGAYAFGMRSCNTSPMTSSWTCCQCRRPLRNSISECPNCEHRRCG